MIVLLIELVQLGGHQMTATTFNLNDTFSRISAIRSLRTIASDIREELETLVNDCFDEVFYNCLFDADYSHVTTLYRNSDNQEITFGCFIDSGRAYWIVGNAPIQNEDDAKLFAQAFFIQ